jgi:hypothetical protein
MNKSKKSAVALSAVTALSGMLAACATTEPYQPSASARDEAPRAVQAKQQQLNYQLASGVYGCEFGETLEIQRLAGPANRIQVSWQGKRHTLQRYDSFSGLPRYEDRDNGLLWIELPWKGVLMDVNSGRPLANECKVTSS